mgnify:FL=1|jgi:uncharacterized ParB-like nuclease family protein|tara:strand:+ start:717 stop:1052 length:336 start_codon:yes stop_codon:yes gene_type:complete
MKTLNILTLLFPILLFSCKSTNNSENKIAIEKMMEAGFIKGTIVTSTIEGDCPITIKVEGKNGTYYLDPIDLREDFQIEGEQVWFKYGGLRRMNRCEKASPISIIEIIKGN